MTTRYSLLLPLLLACAGALRAQTDTLHLLPANIRPFDSAINTSAIELMPLLSPDGMTLYFDRKYSPLNSGGEEDGDEIYATTRTRQGGWSFPTRLGPGMNTTGSDILLWTSRDGLALVASDRAGGTGGHGLFLIDRRRRKGPQAQPLAIEGRRHYGDFVYATVSPDRRHMILSYAFDSTHPDNFDLFLCTATGDDMLHWSAPIPLSDLNTTMYDAAPQFAADNRTIYFITDGRYGSGGVDMFLARRIGDGWTRWSTPKNLGDGVNTMGYDAGVSVAANGLAVVCSETAEKHTNLYEVMLPDSLRPLPTIEVEGRLRRGARAVRGLVRGLRVDADGRREEVTTASNEGGVFRLFLPPGSAWELTAMTPDGESGRSDLVLSPVAGDGVVPVSVMVKK